MDLERQIAMIAMSHKLQELNDDNTYKSETIRTNIERHLNAIQEEIQNNILLTYVKNESYIPATNYVYAYLNKEQELIISSIDLHPDDSELYDKESNFEKCELTNRNENGQFWHKKNQYIRTVRFHGIVKPTTCYMWFDNCNNLTDVRNIENLDTSECTSMYAMFWHCYILQDFDLSCLDTSKVEDMAYMFTCCFSLEHLNLSSWNTKRVKDFSYMFKECSCLQTLDVNHFNIANDAKLNASSFMLCEQLKYITCSQDTKNKIQKHIPLKTRYNLDWDIFDKQTFFQKLKSFFHSKRELL